jgi:mercuric ion binding protein
MPWFIFNATQLNTQKEIPMRNKIILSLLGLSLYVPFSFAEAVKVSVNGMVCSMCAQGITKKFEGHTAIESLEVQLGEKLVNLQIKAGEKISDEEITKLITAAGYSVEGIQRAQN